MRGQGAALATIIIMLVIVGVASALPRDAELGRLSAEGPVKLSSNKNGVDDSGQRTNSAPWRIACRVIAM